MTGPSPRGSAPSGGGSEVHAQVYDRLDYPSFLLNVLNDYRIARLSFLNVCRDADRLYQDATLDDALHFFDNMVANAEDFLGRIQNEADIKKQEETFDGILSRYNLGTPVDPTFEGLLEYETRLANAVRGAEGYARKIGLLIAERAESVSPWDLKLEPQ